MTSLVLVFLVICFTVALHSMSVTSCCARLQPPNCVVLHNAIATMEHHYEVVQGARGGQGDLVFVVVVSVNGPINASH